MGSGPARAVVVVSPVDAGAVLRRRLDGGYSVDEWGLDVELVRLLGPAARVRWSIDGEWLERVPVRGPAVLVFNRRLGWSEPFVVAQAVHQASGRCVRPVGVPDVAGIGPALRRLGGVLDRPDEVAGLLRAGELVALPLGRELRADRAGTIGPDALKAARDAGVPVLPVALVGREIGRPWRLLVGEPIVDDGAAGPLADAEFAEAARNGVQALLDEAVPPTSAMGWLTGRR